MCPNNINFIIIIEYNKMSGQQMPNLQAGFKNNIGPQVELPPPQVLQHMVPKAPTELQVMPTDDNLINVLGMAFQKKYFYLFVGLIVLVAGYFLWKWYGDKGGKKKRRVADDESDDESDDEDEESFDMMPNQNQLLMQQMLQQQQLQQLMAQKNMQQQQNTQVQEQPTRQ